MLDGEKEKRKVPEEGEPLTPKPLKDHMQTIPKCTSEGAGYYLECWECKLEGKTFKYVGETSRSPYQEGNNI